MQDVEKSVDSFRLRWNDYKKNNRKFLSGEVCMQQHLLQHFDCNNHLDFLEEIEIVFNNQTDLKTLKNGNLTRNKL